MEKQKDIFKRQQSVGILLTALQTIIFTNLLSLVIQHPIKAIFNPINFIQNIYEKKTIFYVVSGLLFICARRSQRMSFSLRVAPFMISHFLFTTNLLAGTNLLENADRQTGFLEKKISINISFLFNILVSLVAGVLCSVRYQYIMNMQVFTHTDGLIFYLLKSSQGILNSIMNFYFLDLLLSYWLVALYSFVLRFLLNFVLVILRIQLVYKSPFSILNHIILSNTSVLVYYLLMEVIDRLLIFNTSILNKEFTEFFLDESLDFTRYSFHQISGLSYRYTFVCRMVSKSQPTLSNLEEYTNVEFNRLKSILNKMLAEHKALENKLWITVPQVDKATQRQTTNEHVLSHKQHNFTKRFKTYGLLDRYISRIGYYFKIRSLLNDFNKEMYYVERIDKFINFLVKHRDCYLLLGDFDRRYSEMHKSLLETVKQTEKECEIDLKIKI